MGSRRIPLVVLALGIAVLSVGILLRINEVQAAPALQAVAWTLSGYVFEGEVGVYPPNSVPIQGVTVGLYCADSDAEVGYLLRETTTTDQGSYELDIYDTEVCSYYNIIETDLPDYTSSGASTIGGNVISVDWIQYLYSDLVAGTVITYNNFWDRLRITRYVATTGTDGGNDCTNPGSPCATIQHAIDTALYGDRIYIAGGTYTGTAGTVAVITKELTLVGGYAPDFAHLDPSAFPTVLDAQWGGSVVSITWASDVQLMYLTLTHGDGSGNCGSNIGCGGGIYISRTNEVQIWECVITDNVANRSGNVAGWGGGLYAYKSGVMVWGSQIVSNVANISPSTTEPSGGGGIYVNYGDVALEGNDIRYNVGSAAGGDGDGGGVYLDAVTSCDVVGNSIYGNKGATASYGGNGGGLSVRFAADCYVAGNRIENNQAHSSQAGFGGGVYILHSEVYLARNHIISNSTGSGGWVRPGGGVFIGSNQPVTLTNNLIARNDGGTYGGGLNVSSSSPGTGQVLLVNNTFADNGETGIVAEWYATLVMTNNIIAGHTTGITTGWPSTVTLVADRNLFWNTNDPITGTDGLVADPLLDADYRLQIGSPAIDAGLTVAWLTEDLDGVPRPQGDGYDIGAFEKRMWRIYLPLVLRAFP
ncbi:MAG TPA: hypothetical protein G4O00_13135 [Thermoflexia bacterium]|jgi:hypothetical protein|nr:hypothetical protein [Thermoflexia bacterium]